MWLVVLFISQLVELGTCGSQNWLTDVGAWRWTLYQTWSLTDAHASGIINCATNKCQLGTIHPNACSKKIYDGTDCPLLRKKWLRYAHHLAACRVQLTLYRWKHNSDWYRSASFFHKHYYIDRRQIVFSSATRFPWMMPFYFFRHSHLPLLSL